MKLWTIYFITAITMPLLSPLLLGADDAPQSTQIKREDYSTVELAERCKDSVVALTMRDSDGKKISSGSGFVVNPSGVIVTNYHVADEAASIEAKTSKGVNIFCTGVLTADKRDDLVLLKFAAKNLQAIPLADTSLLHAGQKIVVIGNPLGFRETISEGIISAIRQTEGTELLQISAPISPGSSGSPVFNMQGELVGVAVGARNDGQALNFAISAKELRPMVIALDQLITVPLKNVFLASRIPAKKQTKAPKATPVKMPPPTPKSAKSEGLDKFWKSYWASFFVRDSDVWASHFTDPCDYQYEENRKSKRSEISTSRDNLCIRFPKRDYELLVKPEIKPLNKEGSNVSYDFSFSYEYSGSDRKASGVSHNKLELEWSGEQWLISKFREDIERKSSSAAQQKMRATKRVAASNPKPTPQIASYWDHNGSSMGLLVEGQRRIFIYIKVREGLEEYVKPGMKLFEGASSKERYSGKARRFTNGLPPVEYDVEGEIMDGGKKIVMMGKFPIRNSKGRIVRTVNEKMVFNFLRMSD